MLTRHSTYFLAACVLALLACSDHATSPVADIPPSLTGNWTMKSFDAHVVPANYAEFFNEPVGDHIVAHVEIRLDSAMKQMRGDSTYERRYYFTELHDGQVAFRYGWGDHGVYHVSLQLNFPLQLVSEYIQNLSASGSISLSGDIQLTEPLWLGEDARQTVWIRRP